MFGVLVAVLATMGLTAGAQAQEQPGRTQVMVVASIHQLHENHPHYDYDALYALVRAFEPDWVGVEIRPEDMALPGAEKAQVYAPEMIALADEWGGRAFGFDWLGQELQGRPLAPQWFGEVMRFKQAEQRLAADPQFRDPQIEAIGAAQQVILADGAAAALNDGRYDQLQRDFDQALAARLVDGPYQIVSDFRRARDAEIGRNIVSALRARPGERVVLVMGAAHRAFAVDAIERELGDAVRIVPVP